MPCLPPPPEVRPVGPQKKYQERLLPRVMSPRSSWNHHTSDTSSLPESQRHCMTYSPSPRSNCPCTTTTAPWTGSAFWLLSMEIQFFKKKKFMFMHKYDKCKSCRRVKSASCRNKAITVITDCELEQNALLGINNNVSQFKKIAIVILDCKVKTVSSNCTATPALHCLRQLQQVNGLRPIKH